jgi:hypothetical protein
MCYLRFYVAHIRVVQLVSSVGGRIVFPLDPRTTKPLLALFLELIVKFRYLLRYLLRYDKLS